MTHYNGDGKGGYEAEDAQQNDNRVHADGAGDELDS